MWTNEHQVRHELHLKDMVMACAEEEVAHWLERVDPPCSAAATPTGDCTGDWLASTHRWPMARLAVAPAPWRTVYGWFRRWLALGLFDRLMCEVMVLRRRAAGRQSTPTLGIIDTQTVKCIAVCGPTWI